MAPRDLNSLRPQQPRDVRDPRAFEQRTGIPSLVNTSFNLHGEPIVCSPTDALRTFREGGLDALVRAPISWSRALPAEREA